jgi:GGDEF domain-containing protein
MNKYKEIIQSIFLSYDGQIDQLTGALAPDQFNQIVKRDLALADRNLSQTAIISVVLNLQKYEEINHLSELDKVKSDIENELVQIYYELKNTFRQTDCICRVSKLGFWILLNGSSDEVTKRLIERTRNSLPQFIQINSCQRLVGENLLNWYKRIDHLHFISAK